jgi:hypothetical protein
MGVYIQTGHVWDAMRSARRRVRVTTEHYARYCEL